MRLRWTRSKVYTVALLSAILLCLATGMVLEYRYRTTTPLDIQQQHERVLDELRYVKRGDLIVTDNNLFVVVSSSKDLPDIGLRGVGAEASTQFFPRRILARQVKKIVPIASADWCPLAQQFLTR